MPNPTDRCPDCDLPLANDADVHEPAGCECEQCCALCWSAWHGRCIREPHDWRAEALALREQLDAAQRAALFALNQPRDDADAVHYVGLAVFGAHPEATREILAAIDRSGRGVPQEAARG